MKTRSNTSHRKTRPTPDPFDVHYQPSKAELEREYEMPGADLATLQRAFFQKSKKP